MDKFEQAKLWIAPYKVYKLIPIDTDYDVTDAIHNQNGFEFDGEIYEFIGTSKDYFVTGICTAYQEICEWAQWNVWKVNGVLVGVIMDQKPIGYDETANEIYSMAFYYVRRIQIPSFEGINNKNM